jgi:hypothetical protein
MLNTKTAFSFAAAAALTAGSAHASIVLYSTDFTTGSGVLDGKAVDTSGATSLQHTLYGTSATATWSAGDSFQADGSFVPAPGNGDKFGTTNFRSTAVLAFTPQDGYVYQLTFTTDFDGTPGGGWHAGGFSASATTTDPVNNGAGLSVWTLTRPNASGSNNDQTTFYDGNGGTGGSLASGLDTSVPSTISIRLDTTAGAGDWAASYFVNGISVRTVADLGAVDIDGAGISALYNILDDTTDSYFQTTDAFTSFELSVIPEPSSTMLIGLGGLMLALRRRRGC